MRTALDEVVNYQLVNEDISIDMNALVGHHIHMRFSGKTQCAACSKFVKKLFAQGFCYDCFINAPQVYRPYPGAEMYEEAIKRGFNPPKNIEEWIKEE